MVAAEEGMVLAEGRDDVWCGNATVAAGSFTCTHSHGVSEQPDGMSEQPDGMFDHPDSMPGPSAPIPTPSPGNSGLESHAHLHMLWVCILVTTPQYRSGLAASMPRSSQEAAKTSKEMHPL